MNNYKNDLQERMQKGSLPLPRYTTSLVDMRNNTPVWQSFVSFNSAPGLVLDATSGCVCGKKIDAEQDAARCALQRLEFQDNLNAGSPKNQAPPCTVDVDGQTVCCSQSDQAPPCMVNVPQMSPCDADTSFSKIIYVDADHISFVGSALCRAHPKAQFRFYFAHGANLPYVRSACEQSPNNTVALEASAPIKDLADTMILIDLAREDAQIKSVIVSRDKLLYNASVLLDNVAFTSTKEKLIEWVS